MVMSSDVDPDRGEQFEAAFRLVRRRVATVTGHVREDLLRDVDTPGRYLLVGEWTSREHFVRWLRSPVHDQMTAEVRPFFVRPSTLRFYVDTVQDPVQDPVQDSAKAQTFATGQRGSG